MKDKMWSSETDHGEYLPRNANVPSSNESESEIGKRKINGYETCRVCGDKAYVYNFNALTCESCKAFFRRNALKKKIIPCSFDNKCTITMKSRRYCQACRLQKCFQIGMKTEYIMPAEQLAEKRERLRERNSRQYGQKKKMQNQQTEEEESVLPVNFDNNRSSLPQPPGVQFLPQAMNSTSDTQSTAVSITTKNGSQLISENDTVEMTIRVPRAAIFDILFRNSFASINFVGNAENAAVTFPVGSAPIGDPEASAISTPDGHYFNFVNSTSPAEFEQDNPTSQLFPASSGSHQYSPASQSPDTDSLDIDALDSLATSMNIDWQLPVLSPSFLCLNLKFAKLDELLEVSNKLCRCVRPMFPTSADSYTVRDIYNLMYFSLSRLLNGYGRISAFKQLPAQDQLSLLKYNFNEISTVVHLRKVDTASERILLDDSGREYVELSLMKRVRRGAHYDGFKKLIASFPETWRHDRPLMIILGVLAMFNPDIPNLINRDGVEAERGVYIQLLKDYLENTYGEESQLVHEYLINWVKNLPSLTKQYCMIVNFDLDPTTFDVLFFDIGDVV